MKRTTVFADEDDLAVIKAAAARRGVAEAELIRDAIHLAALAERTWPESFFSQVHAGGQEVPKARAEDVLDDVWTEKADAYERGKKSRR